MKPNDGLTLWLVVIQLLVVLKTGFVSGQCNIPSSTILLTENVAKDTVVANLTTDPWQSVSSNPSGYITLHKDTFNYFYLKAEKEIDVEEMKRTVITVVLECNVRKTITFPVTQVNEFSPRFKQSSYAVQVNEDATIGTVVFKAADDVEDEDFSSNWKFTGQVPDGMFQVALNGEVSVSGTLDFETQKEYTIEIEVKEGTFTNKTKLTINLVDIDDLGPTFIVNSIEKRINVLYTSKMSVYLMGEIPIENGPIFAKDTESDKYKVEYTPLTGSKKDYFSIDSTSGKVSVVKKLPEDENPIILFFTAVDVSPKRIETRATLVISLNNEPITTTQEPTTTTTGQRTITESTTPTTISFIPSSTTPLGVPESEPYSTGEFFGAVGVLLVIIIILIAVIILGYCWWRKRKDDEGYREANLATTKPFGVTDYDSISKTSSKMDGVDNKAANLSHALESGQLPKEDYDSVPSPDTNNFVEKVENDNLYTSFGPAIPDNAVGDSNTDDRPPIDTVVYDRLETIPEPIGFPGDVDGINDNTEAASQLSSEAPVTMTFGDLGKKSNVSFADDNNLLQHDNDGEDNNQTDGLSYVDHINNGGNDDDDKFGEKPNDDEMTWVVADNDGHQHGQDDTEQQADEGSPEETQNQLSQNNEIAYAPLLDDSQRDSWGATNPEYENARL